ncbi:hypothetical protein GCM10009676_24900 [Prauserella halophila]|uniref:Major facilitator superfamily (MFS) profile domain-containing protein n=1 Tax=Prauserella halophila TaxID=185641 RepID=A0ABP4GUR5_9PSEU|nr:MFS transporter [Prauserella halophila]MCP2234875.1 MFS transporter, putative metabolite:H+ symporter [Prauserella halophila]
MTVFLISVVVLGACVVGFVRALRTSGVPDVPGTAPEQLRGMPMADMPEMFVGGLGIVVLALILSSRGGRAAADAGEPMSRRRRVVVAFVATTALTIDISKTSTLGFVIPGMRAEYGVTAGTASLLAVAGLTGTAMGALLAGKLTDRIGRRNVYLVATLGFTVTSMCGGMPTFTGNVVMCLLMGVSVGGLAPVLVTLLADVCPPRHRGPVVVGLSILASAVGYLVASGTALWLEPTYGWRILWLIGAPTGVFLTIVTFLVPNRAPQWHAPSAPDPVRSERPVVGIRLQQSYAALCGVLTFGLTTWVPTLSRGTDIDLDTANAVLAGVALAMVPCAAATAWAYHRFGPAGLSGGLATSTAVMLAGLTVTGTTGNGVLLTVALAMSLFAVNTMAAIFLPMTADLTEDRTRTRTTGNVSFCNRLGGLTGPVLISGLVASTADVLIAVTILALACGVLGWRVTGRRRNALEKVAR